MSTRTLLGVGVCITMQRAKVSQEVCDDELSPLEDFIPISDLIRAGGRRKMRAEFVLNQFAASSNSAKIYDAHEAADIQEAPKRKPPGIRRFRASQRK
jgi:hypothetical protein